MNAMINGKGKTDTTLLGRAEIGRSFLVFGSFPAPARIIPIRQAYLAARPDFTDRVRWNGSTFERTTKNILSDMTAYGTPIPLTEPEAQVLFRKKIGREIQKLRHMVPEKSGLKWKIDLFETPMKGLVRAEIEMPSENYPLEIPGWLGPEITHDTRFANAALALMPPEREADLWNEVARYRAEFTPPAP